MFCLLVQTYASERRQPFPDEPVNALDEYFKARLDGLSDKSLKRTFVMVIVNIFLENATDRMAVPDIYSESHRLHTPIPLNELKMDTPGPGPGSYLFQLVRSALFRYDAEEIVSFSYDSVFEYLIAHMFSDMVSKTSRPSAQQAIIHSVVARLLATAYSPLQFSLRYLRVLLTPQLYDVLITKLVNVIEDYAVTETDDDYAGDSTYQRVGLSSMFLAESTHESRHWWAPKRK